MAFAFTETKTDIRRHMSCYQSSLLQLRVLLKLYYDLLNAPEAFLPL